MTKKFLHTFAILSMVGMSGSIHAEPKFTSTFCVCLFKNLGPRNDYCDRYALPPKPNVSDVIYGLWTTLKDPTCQELCSMMQGSVYPQERVDIEGLKADTTCSDRN